MTKLLFVLLIVVLAEIALLNGIKLALMIVSFIAEAVESIQCKKYLHPKE